MRIINSISRVAGLVAVGLILPLLLLIVLHVFLRFAFNSPITGTAEITQLIMACLVLGIAWTAIQNRHVTVDLLLSRFPPRVQTIVSSITLLIELVTITIITWRGFLTSIFVIMKGKHIASVLLPVPIFPFYWVFVLGCALLCPVIVARLIQEVKGVFKG